MGMGMGMAWGCECACMGGKGIRTVSKFGIGTEIGRVTMIKEIKAGSRATMLGLYASSHNGRLSADSS